MRALFKILIFSAALYGAYALYVRNASEQKLTPGNTLIDVPQNKTRIITCRECVGTGKLVDESGAIKTAYRCPVCNGYGRKEIPDSAKPCHYCRGIGGIIRKKQMSGESSEGKNNLGQRVLGQRCPLCNGSGTALQPN